MQVKDLPGELVESLAGFGERDFSGPAVEDRSAHFFFEDGDSLAHCGLSDSECGGGGGEAGVLGGHGERCQVRKLCANGGGRGFGHWRGSWAGHARAIMSR